MDRKSIEKQFLKYVVPSMFTMLLTGFYTIVDGFFVGRAIGDVGLAAINIAWPITAVMLAVGTGIGTGGSVLMSTHRGENNYPAACRAKGNTVSLLVLASLLLTVLFLFVYPPLLRVLGAAGQVYTAASEYVFVIICGAALQIFGTGFTPLLRNSRKTIAAMVIMVIGLITNIALDWWFIISLQMGMRGAALATITAQGLVAVFSFIVLCRESDPHLQFKPAHFVLRPALCGRILQTAISPFGLSLSPSIILIFNNLQCLAYGGEAAVAAYSVSAYIVESVTLLLSGIGEGIQPLISYFNGAREYDSMNSVKQKCLRLALCISTALSCVLILVRNLVPVAFGTSPGGQRFDGACAHLVRRVLPVYRRGKVVFLLFLCCGGKQSRPVYDLCRPVLFHAAAAFSSALIVCHRRHLDRSAGRTGPFGAQFVPSLQHS